MYHIRFVISFLRRKIRLMECMKEEIHCMFRNVRSDENCRFDEILWTKLADLTKFDKFGNFIKYGNCNEISQIQLTKLFGGIYSSWQEEPHRVHEFGSGNDECVKRRKFDENSPSLLRKLY